MSREIKFRAWDKGNEHMFYASERNGGSEYYFDFVGDSFKLLMPRDEDYSYEVDAIIMQYTGLKDKNLKEIYCGDILSEKWKVEVYQNNEGTFMVKFYTNAKINKPMSLKKYLKVREKAGTSICEGYRDCIVIGNIYENPELIK